jgi:DNA-binding CsgD family transcriptional regulator
MADENKILEKLDQILRVISIQVGTDKSITERARLLKMAGLDNQSIADVLNIPITSVYTLTSNLKTKGKSKRKTKPK